MRNEKAYLVIRTVAVVWIALWINFIGRDLFRKGAFRDYLNLIPRSAEMRRSYVYGDDFFEFLSFAKRNLPEGASFRLEGIEPLSHDHRRAVYYLYPVRESDTAEYILVYRDPEYVPRGVRRVASLDKERYIMRRE